MGIRETINGKPVRTGIAAAVCVLAGALVVWQLFGSRSRADVNYDRAFFSDDDGQTWFIDNALKLPPFDHNGKQAYRAAVYRCGTGKPFVAFLQKYSDSQLAMIVNERSAATSSEPNRPQPIGTPSIPMDAKKPGGASWVSPTATDGKNDPAAYQKLTTPVCPDGSSNVTEVRPSDSDALPR